MKSPSEAMYWMWLCCCCGWPCCGVLGNSFPLPLRYNRPSRGIVPPTNDPCVSSDRCLRETPTLPTLLLAVRCRYDAL
uniref:Putative secreted protein n=1 Tax=Anopheles darlingi TaxID=43151 RepID=A0A2M4D8H7_ANODA